MDDKRRALEHFIEDGTIFTGGVFRFVDGKPLLNSGTIESFRKALELYKAGKEGGFRVGLGLLINDIGTVCNTDNVSCILHGSFSREGFAMPPEYHEVLKSAELKETEIILFWEKQLRNRAMTLYRRDAGQRAMLSEQAEEEIPGVELEAGIPLFRYNKQNGYYVAACPAIMAAFHEKQERLGFSKSINIYYVGSDNRKNIPIPTAISKGTYVAETLRWAYGFHKNFYFAQKRIYPDYFLELLKNRSSNSSSLQSPSKPHP